MTDLVAAGAVQSHMSASRPEQEKTGTVRRGPVWHGPGATSLLPPPGVDSGGGGGGGGEQVCCYRNYNLKTDTKQVTIAH